jgi:hypothetical protein
MKLTVLWAGILLALASAIYCPAATCTAVSEYDYTLC